MLPRPFKDLKWHKGKKHRHRRHLSPLLRGLPVTSQSQSSAYSCKRLQNTASRVVLRVIALPIEMGRRLCEIR